jgi:hypothetical protein
VARPPKPINIEVIRALAESGATWQAMSEAAGVSENTLRRRVATDPELAEVVGLCQENLKSLIVRSFEELVADKHPAAVLFGMKAFCGYSDRPELKGAVDETMILSTVVTVYCAMHRQEHGTDPDPIEVMRMARAAMPKAAK